MIGKSLRKIISQMSLMFTKEKEILVACILKRNSTREKQIILLMIPNAEKEE